MNELLDFLKNNITDEMPLENIVDVFEQMCSIPAGEDMILFETGTFSFTGEPTFQISIVRQFPNDDEYYQVHVDILYKPSAENEMFSETVWNEDISGSIFDYIRKSQAYTYAKNEQYMKTEMYIDET